MLLNSKLKNTNTNNILSLNEIESLPYEDARELILELRKEYSVKNLQKAWNITHYTLYEKVYKKYDIPIENRTRNIVVEEASELPIEKENIRIVNTENVKETVNNLNVENSNVNLNITGIYTGNNIESTLNLIKHFIDGQNKQFEISLSLKEL